MDSPGNLHLGGIPSGEAPSHNLLWGPHHPRLAHHSPSRGGPAGHLSRGHGWGCNDRSRAHGRVAGPGGPDLQPHPPRHEGLQCCHLSEHESTKTQKAKPSTIKHVQKETAPRTLMSTPKKPELGPEPRKGAELSVKHSRDLVPEWLPTTVRAGTASKSLGKEKRTRDLLAPGCGLRKSRAVPGARDPE